MVSLQTLSRFVSAKWQDMAMRCTLGACELRHLEIEREILPVDGPTIIEAGRTPPVLATPCIVKEFGDIALGIDAQEIGRSLTGFDTMKLIAINDAGNHATIREPQDVQFFPSIEDAEREHEPWFSEEPYLAVDSDGARYVFVAADPHVQLKRMPDEAPDPGLYRKFAECTLKYYFGEIALERQPKFEELSLDNLNAFVYGLLVDRRSRERLEGRPARPSWWQFWRR